MKVDIATIAAGYVQVLPDYVVAAAARGDIDLNAIAHAELAARGLGRDGNWIGFDRAATAARVERHDREARERARE